ncbi:MAG TPA: TonB-dependent receptor [Caulobacteraceae bacterium]
MKHRILLATCALSALTLGASGACAAAATATNNTTTIGELVVTAERREENLQDTPVAVSAFTAQSLAAKGMNGGQDILLNVPNVNYTRTNFGSFDLKIRGIGTDVIGFSGTAGVGISENELPVLANHFQDADFYDVQRVEIARGPQGTLYGRNATGGAVDIITNLPNQDFGGWGTVEAGNYGAWKVSGAVNIPLGDAFALRIAGIRYFESGYGENLNLNQPVDGRDLGSIRTTLSFKPNDRLSAYLIWEHYAEDDTRNRVGKQLCVPDPGPKSVGGFPVGVDANGSPYAAWLNQGCIPGSMNSPAAYGNYNTLGTLGGVLDALDGLSNTNLNANLPQQNTNLHDIASRIQPLYKAEEDLVDFHVAYNVTDHLTLTNIFGYNRDSGTSVEDYNRIITGMPFSPTGNAAIAASFPPALAPLLNGLAFELFPNGVVNDPQLGTSNRAETIDYGNTASKEYTDELRLASSFPGKINFTGGLFYSEITSNRQSTNYDVLGNQLTAFSQYNNALYGINPALAPLGGLVYIQPNYPPNGSGHNYYDATSNGHLKTYAAFGEVNYQFTNDLKLTLGARYNVDQLYNLSYPIELLVGTANGNSNYLPYSGGFPTSICTTAIATCVVPQAVTYKEWTGRANLEWTPTVSFTDHTMIYATYSRGYKGGGFNTPCQASLGSSGSGTTGCGYALSYNPEFVDAFEIGTKNTLLHNTLTLDGDVFYYNYSGYQVSTIVADSSVNENVNAKIYGAEFQGVWSPIRNFTIDANVGYLHTRIDDGQTSIDQLNLTQGEAQYTLVKNTAGNNCVAYTAAVAEWMALGEPASGISDLCAGIPGTPFVGTGANQFGVPQQIGGHALPNSPQWTVSVGAQYVFNLNNDVKVTPRVDYYWQDSSWARVYNAVNDYLVPYHVVNATLTFDDVAMGLQLQLFVKNAFNAQPITGTYLTSASSALFTNVFTLDPRTYGARLTKRF